MHMISKKDLNDAEMDTLTKSCSLTMVITANGEVQTHEEATVYVKELDKFLTMKVLENMPAVYRLESFSMKTDILMNGSTVKNHISLKTGFGGIVLHLLQARLLHQRQQQLQQRQVIMRLEKKRTELKVIPLQCLCPFPMLMIERGNPLWTKPTTNFQKQVKQETMIERGNPLSAVSSRASSEILEWLQEFMENLVDDRVPEHRLTRQFFS